VGDIQNLRDHRRRIVGRHELVEFNLAAAKVKKEETSSRARV
jgi:hypothetical protein